MRLLTLAWWLGVMWGFAAFSLAHAQGEGSGETDVPASATRLPTQMDLLDDRRPMRVGDYLVYQVLEEQEAPAVFFVNDQGMLDLPLIQEIPAEGKTCRELANDIKARLEESFFYRATVLLRFRDGGTTRGRYNIVGRIARPGPKTIPADDILTVSMAVLAAGNSLPGADLSRVEVIRGNEEEADLETLVVDVHDVLVNGNLAADRIVRSNDIIRVPELRDATGAFIMTGMIGREGVYQLPSSGAPLMLSEAILNAGGFQQWARRDRVQVIRPDPDDEGEQIKLIVDVEAILEGRKRETDVQVRSGDLIHVTERWFSM